MKLSEHDNRQHAVPLSQRRIDPAADKRPWLVWLRENAGEIAHGTPVVVAILALAGIVIAAVWHMDTLTWQTRRTPLLQGVAVIIDKQVDSTYRSPKVPAHLIVRMNGTAVKVNVTDVQMDKWARTFVGQTVTVAYHSGSGVYVIDDWDPPAARAPISARLLPQVPVR